MDISTIKVGCLECGKESTVILKDHSLDDTQIDLTNIHSFYNRLKCTGCKKKKSSMWSKDGTLLIAGNNVTYCTVCNYPIIQPRLDASPGTTTCVVCAEPKPVRHPHPPVKLPTIPPELKKCSKGHRTEIRMNNTTGEFFIGCSEFPSCWWKRST